MTDVCSEFWFDTNYCDEQFCSSNFCDDDFTCVREECWGCDGSSTCAEWRTDGDWDSEEWYFSDCYDDEHDQKCWWESCQVEGAESCELELCASYDVITSCWLYTQTDGRWYQELCPSHYWNFYDTAENCFLATCSEWSDDYECWQETCDNNWCMTYERYGEEWVEQTCSSGEGDQDTTNDQDASDNQDVSDDQDFSEDQDLSDD